MGWAPGALNSFAFLIRMVLAVCSKVVGPMTVHLLPISEDRLLETFTLRSARDSLTLSLGLSHSKFLRNETVLDHLVDILFFGKRTLVLEVHIAHLLTDVGLVHALRVMSNEPVVDQALTYEVAIYTIGV